MTARVGLVGANWRGEYYLRAAAALPDDFAVTRVLTRTDASAARVASEWNVESTTSLADFGSHEYDYVVVAVAQEVAPDLTVQLGREGHAILMETPPAPARERLYDFYRDVQQLRVQVAEQYQFQPPHAARLRFVASGRLGPVSLVRMSVAHGYHGVSLIRAFLGIGFDPVDISAWAAGVPVISARGRDDWNDHPVESQAARTFARLDFSGRTGIYEFDYEQYVSPIRSRHLEVYGLQGQLHNDDVSYLSGSRRATTGQLQRTQTGVDGDLAGWFVDSVSWGDDVLWENRFRRARLNDDELAVAEAMIRMSSYAAGGEPFYNVADACHDQLISLAIQDAVDTGAPTRVEHPPWASEISLPLQAVVS